MDPPEPQRLSHPFDLLDVVGDAIELGASRTLGFPATELVHQHDSIPELGEVLKWQKVVVRHPGSAGEAEHRPLRRRPIVAMEGLEPKNLGAPSDGFRGARL